MRCNATKIEQSLIHYCITRPLLFSSSNVLPCSVLGNISDATLVSILRIAKPVFYLLIISSFIIFLPILRIRINLEDFPFLFEGLRCNETRTFSVFVWRSELQWNKNKQVFINSCTREPGCHFWSKKLYWFNFCWFCRLKINLKADRK